VLVRQHARDATDNWKHIILALHYGGVPAINSLHSIYNFLDKPWVVRTSIIIIIITIIISSSISNMILISFITRKAENELSIYLILSQKL